MDINFTTTSIIRPKISSIALQSLKDNVTGIDLSKQTIYLNIDPFKENNNFTPVIELYSKYFNNVIVNTPKSPNFAAAVKWCWSNAQTDIIFHFEDDWIFTRKININDALALFKKNTKQVIFTAYVYGTKTGKMSLSPSLITKDCYSAFGKGMNNEINPEIQLRNKKIFDIQPDMVEDFAKSPVVKDIGRPWLQKQTCKKNNNIKSYFIRYE